jgi:hypothetical protein
VSDLIEAIDVISRLIPKLKSFTGERRREYFEQQVKPLFNSFEEVHEFYNALDLDTRRKIIEIFSDSPLLVSGQNPSREQVTKLEEIKEEFFSQRQKNEHLRDALRQDAQEMFKAISWREERRFLASVVYYFLGCGGIQPQDSDLDRDIKEVIEKGGTTYLDTPSMRLYNSIREEINEEKLLRLLDESRSSLNQMYMNVRRHFRQVQDQIIMRT